MDLLSTSWINSRYLYTRVRGMPFTSSGYFPPPQHSDSLALEPLPIPHGRLLHQAQGVSGVPQPLQSLRAGVGVKTPGSVKAIDDGIVTPGLREGCP